MFACCKSSQVNKQANFDLTRVVPEKASYEESWFEDNLAPSNYFNTYFKPEQLKDKSMPHQILAWIPNLKEEEEDQFVLSQTRKSLDTILELYNVFTGVTASTLRLWEVTVTKSALIAQKDGYLCFLWDPSRPRVSIVKISLVEEKLYPVGFISLGDEISNLLITNDGAEIWAISSFWPQIQITSTITRRKLYQFRVLNESKGNAPLTFCRYETLWLSDMKAAILVGFNEGLLHVFRINPHKKSAEAIFSCPVSEAVKTSNNQGGLVPRINMNYNNSSFIILADGGLTIFVFKLAKYEKRLSATLLARLCVSPQINRLLGEGKEAVFYRQNQWLLVRYRYHVGVFWIGPEACEFSLIAAINIGQHNCLSAIFLDKQNFWVQSDWGISKYQLLDWTFDEQAKTKIKNFNLPITAVKIKCSCSRMSCQKSLVSTFSERTENSTKN